MSTTSEIKPAETNANDPSLLNHNHSPSQSQPSTLTNKQNPENNEASKQVSIPETKEVVKQDANVKRMIIQEKGVLSNLISADVDSIKQSSEELQKYKDKVSDRVAEAERRLYELNNEGDESTEKDYWELKKAVTKLRLHMPVKKKLNEAKDQHYHGQQSALGILEAKPGQKISAKVLEKFPHLHGSNFLKNSRDFKDFEARYNDLSSEMKLCLLCFSVFPEDVIIKKRLMVYWWIAEGFVPPKGAKEDTENGKTAEDFGNDCFYELMGRGFIEPANKKRSISVKACRMHPLIRFALVMIAQKAKFFNFDSKGEPIENFIGSLRACLVGNGLLKYEDLRDGKIRVEDLEKVHLVFNVNENFLEFKTEWFLQMKNVNILYLGRWKILATDHIEMEDTEFLHGLKIMKYLKFFNLQGVSRIIELPQSVTKLSNLKILDVRACHNLETIPKDIGLLKNLTHLDMSECYLLERMPKSLAMLLELRVLKGFVIGNELDKNSCALEHLAKLEKLKKLSIYTGSLEFPTEKHVRALQNLQALRKLTITWGGAALHALEDRGKDKKERTGAEEAKATTKRKEHTKNSKKDNTTAEQIKPKSELQKAQASSSRPLPDKQDQVEDEKKANATAEAAKSPAKSQTSEASPAESVTEEKKQGEHKMKNDTATEQAKAPSPIQKTEASLSKPSHDKQDKVEDKKKLNTAAEAAKGAPVSTQTTAAESKAQALTQKPAASLRRLDAFKGDSWKLEKLDLKCYPTTTKPSWLTPSNFRDLKKLYIRGGKFSDLGQYEELLDNLRGADLPKWDVEILRLKYLSELEMDWRELQELFPELIYLEKVGCPKLTFFPCDATGVWINKEKLKKSDHKIAIFSPSRSY